MAVDSSADFQGIQCAGSELLDRGLFFLLFFEGATELGLVRGLGKKGGCTALARGWQPVLGVREEAHALVVI